MTGIPCKQDNKCEFYRSAYTGVYKNPVINPDGDRFTCDVIDWFKEKLSKKFSRGSAKLSEDSLKKLNEIPLECVVLEGLNKNS